MERFCDMSEIKPKISILLPAYKSEGMLGKVFLDSLTENTTVPVELVLYDNGGNDFTEEFKEDVKAYHWNETYLKYGVSIDNSKHLKCALRIIGDGKNIGLNKALNECAKVARGEYFYLPHTDMHLLPGWDVALLNEAKNLPPLSFLMCSRSIEPGYSHIPSQIVKDYGNDVESFRKDDLLKDYQQYVEQKVVVNARMPFFLTKKLWDKIGGVDENYFSYCTDDDLIQQCYDAGVRRFWMIGASLVYHLQGKSNAKQTVDRDSQKPYEYFVEKWKKKYPHVTHPGQYHPKLIPFETRIK